MKLYIFLNLILCRKSFYCKLLTLISAYIYLHIARFYCIQTNILLKSIIKKKIKIPHLQGWNLPHFRTSITNIAEKSTDEVSYFVNAKLRESNQIVCSSCQKTKNVHLRRFCSKLKLEANDRSLRENPESHATGSISETHNCRTR